MKKICIMFIAVFSFCIWTGCEMASAPKSTGYEGAENNTAEEDIPALPAEDGDDDAGETGQEENGAPADDSGSSPGETGQEEVKQEEMEPDPDDAGEEKPLEDEEILPAPAALRLSEVRTEYKKPFVEFIEFYAAAAGSLDGLRIICAGDGGNAVYRFPAAEVAAGEFIVVHIRKTGDECIDEIDDITLSGGNEAFPYARDFWMENTEKMARPTNVILLEFEPENRLIDALLIAESTCTSWPDPMLESAAERAFSEGVWTSGSGIEAAAVSDGVTRTRTINRLGSAEGWSSPAGKEDWIVVATNKATPGAPNSDIPYVSSTGG